LAQELDAETLATLAELNLPAFAAHLERHRSGEDGVQTAMCGAGGAMTAALCALDDGDAELQILKQTNSGDSGGDLTRVVGYAAAVFVRRRSTLNQAEFSLPEDICHELLSLARRRLATAMDGERLEYEPSSAQREILSQPGAVFVTLRKDGQLRGCMGTTQARDSLWHAVYDLAYSAGFHDPRFPSLTAGELADVTIEISVLSPLVPIRSHAEITPNVHGVVVRQGDRSGVFLPQVWEQLPNKEDFLTFLCLEKARIPADAWRDGTAQLERFTVFSFEEEDRP
jgi:AmmeMemoRadiSam system protein A